MAWREAPRNLIWALPWDCMSCIIDFLRSHSSLSGASSQALSAQLLSSASQNFVDVPQMESQAWRRSQHASMGVGSDCLALNLRCGCAAAPFRDAVLALIRPRLKATGKISLGPKLRRAGVKLAPPAEEARRPFVAM